MLKYDEMLLMLRLEPLDRSAKTAFAAACAQRLVPLSDRYALQVGDSSRLARLGVIVSATWEAASGRDVEASRLSEEAELMVPDEDDEGWRAGRAYASNAATAASYALRTWLTNDPQEAAWAARQLFDVADLVYFQANPGGSFVAEEQDKASLESPLVQPAISAIHRDLEAIENAWPWLEVRQRAEEEGRERAASVP
ncbi:DUF416 family protein [Paenarthrobacter sp. NPDC089322]|uniref:DUF416 family protein n=1 Tax=Paenarthrobacter sp. NPDC089322 TaxID=3155065 RepID=UPI0034262FE0